MEGRMSMSRLGYDLKQAFSQMIRNKGMYFTSIMAISAMMLILGLFFIAFVNLNLFTQELEKDYNVIQIYLKTECTAEQIQGAGRSLESIDGVDHITYTTRDQALESLRKRWGENGYLLENLPENPLPDSYTVYVTDKDAADRVAAEAPEIDGVDDVAYYRSTIDKLTRISRFTEMGSIAVMLFLVIVSVVIVANTIKLTVFNREKEIGIMKYLGATDRFVRAPFVWSGITLGVVSAGIATGLTYLIYLKIVELIGDDVGKLFSASVVPPTDLVNTVLVIFLCIGISIGISGSMISIRRFLDR